MRIPRKNSAFVSFYRAGIMVRTLILCALGATTIFIAAWKNPHSNSPKASSHLALKPSVALNYPSYFPKPHYNFARNPLDSSTIALGQHLFYDPILSRDTTISCASCHSPYNSFAHSDHDLSHGIDDQIGTRNAPALINLAWQRVFMWDGAINHLDMQALAPISHPKEMDETITNVVSKLQRTMPYSRRFYAAFGDSTVTGERLLKALAQFQLTLVSAESKYDQMRQGRAQFNEYEKQGYKLFLRHCNACHTEPLFTSGGFENNGLLPDSTLRDVGRSAITQNARDSLRFKVPTLRNVEFTAPYMHDGRYQNLAMVLFHYSTNIHPSPTLSPRLKNRINLSENDKRNLIAFLKTLSDESFLRNEKFLNPPR